MHNFLMLIVFIPSINFVHALSDGKRNGIVFSPFVRKVDNPETLFYTREIIKIMLEVVLDGGFNSVTTYGVGASNVHTALAAAEINKQSNTLSMTVVQGLFISNDQFQVDSEIKIGLETVQQANKIFPNTVSALVYSVLVPFSNLIDNNNLNAKMKTVSAQVHALNVKFGVRLSDCSNVPTGSSANIVQILESCDFIICLALPIKKDFPHGQGSFKSSAKQIVMKAEEFVRQVIGDRSNISTEIILETGWPGDSDMKSPNSLQDLLNYWNGISAWVKEYNKAVFLHEAFDSPWKEDHPEWPLASHFGRWKYDEKEPDLKSEKAYILKSNSSSAFLGNFGASQIGVLAGALVLLGVVSMMTYFYKRLRKIEGTAAVNLMLSEYDMKMFFDGIKSDEAENYVGEFWDLTPYNSRLECDKRHISIDKTDTGLLGKGQFGCVYKGELCKFGYAQEVAVKMTKPFCPRQEIICLLSEIKILAHLSSNEHICNILAAYTKEISKGVVYFAMELCPRGNLEKFLRDNRYQFDLDLKASIDTATSNETITMSEQQMVRWALQMASAMEYISLKNVIHSDLAARNILLSADYATKVTDFGLSRRFLEEQPTYTKAGSEPLPYKWLAPESLENKTFSTKSDVYSYGVTLWEIFSLGSTPWSDEINSWKDLLAHLKAEKLLEQPEHASESMYAIMTKCWQYEPQTRPSFSEIKQLLLLLIESDYRELTE